MNGMFGMGMKTFRVFLLLSSAFVLFSCGVGTFPVQTYGPYRNFTWADQTFSYGYSEVALDSTSYQVSFADIDHAEADRLSLYRSAELTDQHGFDYFIVSGTSGGSATKTIRMYKGDTPTDNPSAYNAKSMLTTMGPTINK